MWRRVPSRRHVSRIRSHYLLSVCDPAYSYATRDLGPTMTKETKLIAILIATLLIATCCDIDGANIETVTEYAFTRLDHGTLIRSDVRWGE